MDFTNVNDPAGVRALLEQLRASQAWRDIVNPPNSNPSSSIPADAQLSGSHQSATSVQPESSVAALLSQLRVPPHPPANTQPTSFANTQPAVNHSFDHAVSAVLPTQNASRPSAQPEDVRSLTFYQALPHLARLADDPDFRAAIIEMKQEQTDLERQLWEERLAIQRKHEERVKVAQVKADMIGAGFSKHEAMMMTEGFRKELFKFDLERVLPAWDGLITKQQAKLFSLRVPTMFVTNTKADREKQQRIVQVLEGMET